MLRHLYLVVRLNYYLRNNYVYHMASCCSGIHRYYMGFTRVWTKGSEMIEPLTQHQQIIMIVALAVALLLVSLIGLHLCKRLRRAHKHLDNRNDREEMQLRLENTVLPGPVSKERLTQGGETW
jgi:hypothetical protein